MEYRRVVANYRNVLWTGGVKTAQTLHVEPFKRGLLRK